MSESFSCRLTQKLDAEQVKDKPKLVALGASNTNLHVYVSNCIKQVYKPKSITMACADAGFVVSGIKYSSYGAKTAAGTGGSPTRTVPSEYQSGAPGEPVA